MKKFLVLYCAPSEAMDEMVKEMTPEQKEAGMQPWLDWRDRHTKSVVDFGAPVGKNKRVMPGGETKDVRNDIGGYSIIQAESPEQAAEIVKDSPNFGMAGAYIEVLPIMEL
jgi:hypothetical protein